MSGEIKGAVIPVAVHGDKPESLTAIFQENVNLAIWQRTLPKQVTKFATQFALEARRFERFLGLDAKDQLDQILPGWALELPGASAWLDDVQELIEMYRCLFEPAAVGVRLHVLPNTMCPRFHTDRVPTRLLVTYSGRGTEWLPERIINRRNEPGPLPDQEVSDRDIQVMPTGAVCLLKGEAWVGNEGRGVVHRSPAPSNQPRLVLGLDWLS
ncbi:DUF1826 domain-containing protein [Marinobacter sp. AL4B]|uniref:DUF1826 domain-containing protein n=1 Tax=Marinobacter sp. AL4B TaxID=2871173 RepID=UPI001CAA7C69|nr:DUF1826 domain-containing protein [Marinobacter sp. AL4B]MBZ0335336.1 DUF1826 domain-containing protein [Marinobacter sp. AL4B]